MTTGDRYLQGSLSSFDGVRLSWQAWLPPDRPRAQVVLVHAAAEHGGRYGHLVSGLVDQGLSVHAADLRGHGRSGGRRGSVARFTDYLDDLERFISRLPALGSDVPTFLVGYSIGGLIALRYAIDHQQDLAGVVAAAPALGLGDRLPGPLFTLAKALGTVAPRLRLLKLDPTAMMGDDSALHSYRDDPLVFHGRVDMRLMAESIRMIERVPAQLGGLHIPVLVVHGTDDRIADPGSSAAALERVGSPDRTLLLYDGLRHDLLTGPGRDRVCRDVTRWIRDRLPRNEDQERA